MSSPLAEILVKRQHRLPTIEDECAALERELLALPPDVAMAMIGKGDRPRELAALVEYLRQEAPARVVLRLLANALENGWRSVVHNVGLQKPGDPGADHAAPSLVFVPEGWKVKFQRRNRMRTQRNAM